MHRVDSHAIDGLGTWRGGNSATLAPSVCQFTAHRCTIGCFHFIMRSRRLADAPRPSFSTPLTAAGCSPLAGFHFEGGKAPQDIKVTDGDELLSD